MNYSLIAFSLLGLVNTDAFAGSPRACTVKFHGELKERSRVVRYGMGKIVAQYNGTSFGRDGGIVTKPVELFELTDYGTSAREIEIPCETPFSVSVNTLGFCSNYATAEVYATMDEGKLWFPIFSVSNERGKNSVGTVVPESADTDFWSTTESTGIPMERTSSLGLNRRVDSAPSRFCGK